MPEYSPRRVSVQFPSIRQETLFQCTFCVLTDENSVHTVIGSLVADDGLAGPDICEKVECAAESQVEGDVALSNGGL
jgi:hypothetical protein